MHNGIDGVLRCVYNRIDHDGALNRSVQACRVALESDFSRFDPLPRPVARRRGPTLATLVRPRGADFSNFACGVDRRPFCGGARRCGVGAAPHFSTPGAKRPTLAGFVRIVPICTRVHFSRFDPKVPHFSR
jgi:hypothetical protein